MLEFIMGDPRPDRRPVVLLDTPGSGSDTIAAALASAAVECRRRLLPAPPITAPAELLRRWHRDAWTALGSSDRAAVALILGPSAGYLAPVLGGGAEAIALVQDPGEALRRLVKPRRLEALVEAGDEPSLEDEHGADRLSNGQSRALLAPWHDTDELAVGNGPPPDADHWRELLFEDVLPRLDVHPSERRLDVARDLADRFGWAPKRVTRLARDPVPARRERRARDIGGLDSLLAASWLDQELRERCSPPATRSGAA